MASGLNNTFSGYEMTFLSVALLIAVAIFRRWRHLFVLIATIAITGFVGGQLDAAFSRPRPYDVTIIGNWEGFAMPSLSIVILVNLLLGIAYTMVPAGRLRTIAKVCTAVIVAAVGAAGLYLGVDHPSDVVVAVALSVAVSLVMFRTFTPNETFPVHYRGGKTAHLDVGGLRGQAIRHSIRDQLGFMVTDARHVGLAGSGGSTPLRLTVSSDSDYYLFAKLYAMSHVRADRWYKLGRTILYGRLEDEAPFQSVRRLVEYEDYAARVLRDNGIPTADSFGIVEITPEREYILVTEFFDGAQEISDAPVDDRVIDNGLIIVRRLWDAGLAHRDIKPANLLVRNGQVFLIDAFFVQVRPSPWRQAIDLANMMLVLALRTDCRTRATSMPCVFFTEDEIAEAFAATRGVASPTQLRAVMKRDGRDLVSEFRALAPARAPVTLQRWSVLRVLLAVGVLAGAALSAVQVVNLLQPRTDAVGKRPTCGTDDVMVLMAEAVPEATMIPCIGAIPAGWTVNETNIASDRARFSLNSDTAGPSAVEATLMPRADCDVTDAVPVADRRAGYRTLRGSTAARAVAATDPVLPLRRRLCSIPAAVRFRSDRRRCCSRPIRSSRSNRDRPWSSKSTTTRACGCVASVSPARRTGERPARRRRHHTAASLLFVAVGSAVLVVGMVFVRDGAVPTWERDLFEAVNDLPGPLLPVLWPFQQLGAFVVGSADWHWCWPSCVEDGGPWR